MDNLKPMDAVAALYSRDDPKLSAAIIASLSRAVFDVKPVAPSGPLKRAFVRLSHRILSLTTKTSTGTDETGSPITLYRNAILERSGHPYARALMGSSSAESAALVEGGDPMNGPYMMLSPEIRKNGTIWDRLFLDSVQSRDVQVRIIWEARATYEAAKRWLERSEPVRMKAVAGGTGLSMMLVYDKLIRDGFNPELITAKITDRDPVSIEKARRLLDTLANTQDPKFGFDWKNAITAETEDIFADGAESGQAVGRYDVLTAIGILEYFHGSSHSITEHRLNVAPPEPSVTAHDLVKRLSEMTTDRANLIVNTYKTDASVRILELFGRRFVYRKPEDLRELMAAADFRPVQIAGSGNIYDVKVYEKNPPAVK